MQTNFWLATPTGDVLPFGSAPSYGSINFALNQPIVGIAATPDNGGYWLATQNGGVYPFGDAVFKGSPQGKGVGRSIVGIS